MLKEGEVFSLIKGKKYGQVSIFVIIGIVLVAGVVGYFIFFNDSFGGRVPSSLEPAYSNFQNCIEEDLGSGVDVLGSQGGYIYLPEFESGSTYSPFSSQLDFLGNGIPYWYYVSGNGLEKEQVPTISSMEGDLEKYVEDKIGKCNFDSFYEDGFFVEMGEPKANVKILDDRVEIELDMDLGLERNNDSAVVNDHKVVLDSKLGAMYKDALEIYNEEKESLFLEERTIDVLRLYAPVDGVEIQCAPKVWVAEDVFQNLGEALEANTLALKVEGSDYSLNDKNDDYFVIENLESDFNVNFISSKNWPYMYEVNPAEDNILISKPVGNQEGLGILGFCYVPYHYVYDVKYPVLVQLYDDASSEIFQFPLAVVIDDNNPREPLEGAEAYEFGLPELCEYKNTDLRVEVYDSNLGNVDANISYSCFGSVCSIGESSGGVLNDKFPQCVNGKVIARTEGYEVGEYEISSVNSGNVDIILNKLYEKEVELRVDGREYSGEGIISFVKENGGSETIVYPEINIVSLSEGQYSIEVTIYRDSTLTLGASTKQECIEVPSSGIGGLFGFTKEKCIDIEIPEQTLMSVLYGGGKQEYYITQSELEDGSKIVIDAESLPVPNSLEQLQDNYMLYEESDLGVYIQ
jgi:hypothetical protein